MHKRFRQWKWLTAFCVLMLVGIPVSRAQQQTPAPAENPTSATAAAELDAQKQKAIEAVQEAEKRKLGILTDSQPKPIDFSEVKEPLETRLARKITLDVREMSIVDIIRFLALKGDLNVVTSGAVQGRATFFLKSVSIQDSLDIAVMSNNFAYAIENDIVRVMSEQEYEAMYGKKFNDKNIVEIVKLKYAKPDYALSTLDNLKTNLGRIIIDEDTGTVVMIDTPESVDRMKKTIKEMENPLEAVVYSLQYAKADVIAEKLRTRIDAQTVGSITVDERSNKLIVRAFPDRRAEVEKLIKELDKPTKEVLVEARVLQVVFKPQYDMGIDWQLDFRNSPYQALQRTSFKSIFLDKDNLTSSDRLFSKFGEVGIGNFDANKFEAAIRALKQVNDTKILSNPRILVTNNQEAKIHVGDTVPYIVSTTSGTGDNAITSEDVRFVDVGLKLNVTPTINDDGMVTLVLNPEVSTVVGSIESQGGGIPQVNKTEVETTVMVQDGMTVVLGGLKKENKIQTRRGIPGLMDIPFVKRFFSATSDSIELTEIVIFITPHIVTGKEPYDRLKGDIKPAKEYRDTSETLQKVDMRIKE